MKIILLILLILNLNLLASEEERAFWNEIKNSQDIEDFTYYREKYKDGIFDYLALKSIKKLRENNKRIQSDTRPNWIKGDEVDHRYYAVAFASKHYKGEHYSENLARQRAKDKLMEKFEDDNVDKTRMLRYNGIIKSEVYRSKNARIYVMVYIDNYEI